MNEPRTVRRRARGPRQELIVLTFRRRTFHRAVVATAAVALAALAGTFYLGRASMPRASMPRADRTDIPSRPPEWAYRDTTRAESAAPPGEPPPGDDGLPAVRTTPVGLSTSAPASAPVAPAAPVIDIQSRDPRDGYGVQLAAFPSRAAADTFMKEHAHDLQGRTVYIVARARGEIVWYRIRVGRFAAEDDAEAFRRRMPETLGASALVVKY